MTRPTAVEPVGVFLVDDHPVVRDGLRALLSREGMIVVGEATDAESALEQISMQGVDVVVTDVRLPGMSGLELCHEVVSRGPEPAVVVLSGYVDRDSVTDAFEAGAMAYVVKDVAPDELFQAIHAAARGERRVDHRVAERVGALDGAAGLASNQIELLRLLGRGLSVREVAARMEASPHTIRARLRRIYHRLGCSNLSEAISIALRRGLL